MVSGWCYAMVVLRCNPVFRHKIGMFPVILIHFGKMLWDGFHETCPNFCYMLEHVTCAFNLYWHKTKQFYTMSKSLSARLDPLFTRSLSREHKCLDSVLHNWTISWTITTVNWNNFQYWPVLTWECLFVSICAVIVIACIYILCSIYKIIRVPCDILDINT